MATSLGFFLVGFGASAMAQAPAPGVVSPDGLMPGAVSEIWVGLDPSAGDQAPRVSSDSAIRLLGSQRPGVWRYAVNVPKDADELTVNVGAFGRSYGVTLPVWSPAESGLEFPRRINGQTGAVSVQFDVVGNDLPPPEALQVVLGEGRLVSVVRDGDALRVTVAPDNDPFPRNIIVGVRDRRALGQPIWGMIRLRARPSIPLQSEPGSSVRVWVSDREYGPFEADSTGRINAKIDQYPGEVVASALFEDDLGNTTRTDIPLATQSAAQLTSLVTDDRRPGRAPILFLHGLQSDGFPWRGTAPVCQTPAEDLAVRELARGTWMVVLPTLGEQVQDLRIDCVIGQGAASTRTRVPVVRGVPARVALRVWPSDLRTDFPFAEVRVVLEDHRGDRMPVDQLMLRAERGAVEVHQSTGTELQADYDGSRAGAADVVHANWTVAPEDGWVHHLLLAWDAVPMAGRVTVHARAVDAAGHPVEGQAISLDAGSEPELATTDATGWATAQVLTEGVGPVPIHAQHAEHEVRGLLLRGEQEKARSDFDLDASALISLTPGRIAGISVDVEPSLLRAAPGAVAYVTVALEDRGGSPIIDEEIAVSVTEGDIGPLHIRADGTWVAEYYPAPGDRPREVEITAQTDTVRTTTTLDVQPRVVRVSVGPWAGVHGNLGAPSSPILGLDIDFRVRSRLAGEGLMMRVGAATYRLTGQASTGLGGAATLDARMVPITGATLFRRDWGRFGAWGGVGGILAVQDLQVGFGQDIVSRGARVLAGGTGIAGAGWRMLGGELTVQVQSAWIPSGGGEVAFAGNIGGLASGLGFRVVF